MIFLVTASIVLLAWLILLVFSARTRTEQITMSIVGLCIAPAILLLAFDDPRSGILSSTEIIGLADFVFIPSFFGIAAIAYEVMLGSHLTPAKKLFTHAHHNKHTHWIAQLVIICGVWFFGSLFLMLVLPLGFFSAFGAIGALIGIHIVLDRHDLLFNAIASGLLMALLIFALQQLFFIRFFPELIGAPSVKFFMLSELLWATVVGFTIGPLYEYARNLTTR